jgi:hypothetical protein
MLRSVETNSLLKNGERPFQTVEIIEKQRLGEAVLPAVLHLFQKALRFWISKTQQFHA